MPRDYNIIMPQFQSLWINGEGLARNGGMILLKNTKQGAKGAFSVLKNGANEIIIPFGILPLRRKTRIIGDALNNPTKRSYDGCDDIETLWGFLRRERRSVKP